MGNTVKLYMNDKANCKILIGADVYKKSIFSSSALQRPEIQETRLLELLRKNLRHQLSRKKQKNYWKTVIDTSRARSANSNTQEIA